MKATERETEPEPDSESGRTLWPDDEEPTAGERVAVYEGPDTELAVILLASGCTPEFIKARANFPTLASVRAFARDDDVKEAIKGRRKERVDRVADRAMVRLEQLLAAPHKDSKALVLAIRTALAASGTLYKPTAPETKQVQDLSAAELAELIAMTRKELASREPGDAGQYRPSAPALLTQ